jgi:hypothetical protein
MSLSTARNGRIGGIQCFSSNDDWLTGGLCASGALGSIVR